MLSLRYAEITDLEVSFMTYADTIKTTTSVGMSDERT